MDRQSWPGRALVAGAIIVALAFPATPAGSIALAIVAGAVGIWIARTWPSLASALATQRRLLTALAFVFVAFSGLLVFKETLTESPDWQMGDWGPQHAVLSHIMPSLPGVHVPVWNHLVSTGDAPLELYPAATYLVTGHLAVLFGLEHDLALAWMIFATLVHISLALLTTALAMRFAPRIVAVALGLLWLVDSGEISHGGTVGLFRWAIVHSAFAQVFSMIAVLAIIAALKRPRLGYAVTIWLATAIATASHPAALLMAAACAVALLAVAALAADVRPRRAMVVLGHLGLGAALGAVVWLPGAQRLLAYGQHFSNEMYSPVALLQLVMSTAMPMTVYSGIVYLGYAGSVVGTFSRRADVVFVAVAAITLLAGLCNLPYLGFGLLPKLETARLGVIRMMLLVRPFFFALAAFAITELAKRAAARWTDAPRRNRIAAAALLGIVGGVCVRVLPDYWTAESQRAYAESRVFAADPDGRHQLVAWAREQAAGLGPTRWARALFEQNTHEQQHLTAETGLPTFHMGPIPGMLLRERIEDTSPESLARFNVRWVVGVGTSPTLGDPASEIELGTYHIREIPTWDGAFARIEKGTGSVVVRRLESDRVDIEVTGAREPVLVALGTGFYPRWRAHDERGRSLPVYALPATPKGSLHVVSAWVPPGHTTFSVDGDLPSDGAGTPLAIAALLIIIAVVVLSSRARWRIRILRRVVQVRSVIRTHGTHLAGAASGIAIGVLMVRGCVSTHAPATSLEVGSGVRGAARVEARIGEQPWQPCDYLRVRGEYDCDGLVTVTDTTVNLVNDAPPSWPFITPAIIASAYRSDVEVRITRRLRLAGRYWVAATSEATLVLDDDAGRTIDHSTTVLDLPDRERVVQVSGTVPFPSTLRITLVAEDTVQPPRPHLVAPPDRPAF